MYRLLVLAMLFASSAFAQGLVLKYMEMIPPNQPFSIQPLETYGIPPDYFDLDGNGVRDLVWMANEPSCTVFGMPGRAILWSSPNGVYVQGCPIFADFDGDQIKDVMYWTGGQSCQVISRGSEHVIFVADSLGPMGAREFLSDFDGDGFLDIGIVVNTPQSHRFEIWGAGSVTSSPPTSLVIIADGDDLNLTWGPVDSCSMYEVEWSLYPFDSFASVGKTCELSFRHAGASIASRAIYHVRAVTSTFESLAVATATYVRETDAGHNHKIK